MAVKKAIFFTIDSLLASGIVIVAILLVSTFYVNEHKRVNVSYASQDLVRVFSVMKIGEVNNEYVQSLIDSGEITSTNNTIIEQIGDFWAQDKMGIAKNLITDLTDQLIPSNYGLSIVIDGEEIYSRSVPIKKALVSSRKLVSGITKAQPTEGYTARVLLQGIKSKKTSTYVYFGGYEGDGDITKKLILPNDVISFNDSYLEVDSGGNFSIYINGFFSGDYIKESAGGGVMLADKWNLTGKNLTFFKAGENVITLNFTSGQSYIAGGFLKVTYLTSSFNGTEIPGYEKTFLPGIDGAINIYTSSYFPINISNMSMYIHFLSSTPIYATIGNSTVFDNEGSNDEQMINLSSSNLSYALGNSSLNFSSLSGKTVPVRIGLRDAFIKLGGADSVLITDRTHSMISCDVPADCSAEGLCDTNPLGGCHLRRIAAAANSDRKFINVVLNDTKKKNEVALVGFGFDSNPVCDTHEFSQDNASLQDRINYYNVSDYCGDTCISCSIYSATQLLTEKEKMYGYKKIFAEENRSYYLGFNNINFRTFYFNVTVNPSNLVKARLLVFGNKVATDLGYQDCVYFNGRYIGRICEAYNLALDYHSCDYALKPEWFNSNKNNVTLTGGTKTSCFGGVGLEDAWNVTDISLIGWENPSAPNIIYNSTYDTPVYSNGIELNKTSITNRTIFNISDVVYLQANKTKIKSAYLEFEAANGSTGNFNCVYVNGNYIGRIDWQEWNSTKDNQWQKILYDVPAAWLRNGTNEINLSSGTNTGNCKGTIASAHTPWRFRNLNLTVRWSDYSPEYLRHKSMLVMSDGAATDMIDYKSSPSSDARNETIKKACEAHKLYGISIYTVAMGNVGDTAIDTLNHSACCDDCSHFYQAQTQDELIKVYANISEMISSLAFAEGSQSSVTGSLTEKTHLFPDSYIDFNYTYDPGFYFNRVPLTFETSRFGNNISSGLLLIYPNTTFSDGKVTSYSGDKWTDKLLINNLVYFNLSDYGTSSPNDPSLTRTYKYAGDPFVVNIPSNAITKSVYNITISTGINSTNPTNGSPDDRIIYSLLIKSASDYSDVVEKSSGCSWTVSFEDGTVSTIKVPADYNGNSICDYASKVYDTNDALDNAVYQLFSNLDLDKNGKLDFNIDQNSLSFITLTFSKVPSLWGPAVIDISVWE